MARPVGSGVTPVAERFWALVRRSAGCWEWAGGVQANGYGRFREVGGRRGRTTYAHRMAWKLTHGSDPPSGSDICHTCDNRRCVRPDHLFLGSRLDNMRDAAAKGRWANQVARGWGMSFK